MSTDVPRTPSAYRPSLHFGERFHDRYDDKRRHLDDEIVRRCIEDGELVQIDPGQVYFEEIFGGVRYRLVVNPVNKRVVTGYPIEIRLEEARESGRWSEQQIQDILAFIRSDPDTAR